MGGGENKVYEKINIHLNSWYTLYTDIDTYCTHCEIYREYSRESLSVTDFLATI